MKTARCLRALGSGLWLAVWLGGTSLGINARADGIFFSFGPSLNSVPNPKLAQLGYGYDFGVGELDSSCGGIFEAGTNGYCSAVVSERVKTSTGVFTRVGIGPAAVFHTDDRLSSIFEFNIQYAIGIDQNGYAVGLIGNHFSNAGIVPPNPGRDFFGLLVEFRF